jgi:hypothetical protein
VYSLPDEALAGGAQMRIRCKACQTMIDVKSGGAVTAVWYAMLAGAQAGPFDVEQLKAKIAAQELDAQTLVWKQGLAEWKAAAQVDEVKALLPAVAASGLGDALFDDVHDHAPSQGELKLSDHDEKKKAEEATEEAALKALAPTDPAKPPGEVTKYFINQSGANKRNPPWKIALFGMAFIGGPVAVLYLLATFRIVPMEVTHTNENGEVVTESFFSSGGVSGVADFLSGKEAKRKAERDAKVVREAQARRQREKDLIAQAQTGGTNLDLDSRKGSQTGTAAMGDPTLPGTSIGLDIGQAGKKTFEPKLRGMGTTPAPAQGSGGLDDAAAAKVVAQSQNAFQGCIENALRRNPNMKVGKVEMTVTVGHSGSVLRSAIAPKQHDTAEWGVCLKERAKRMVFPPFEGDDEADVKVPLVVGVSAL